MGLKFVLHQTYISNYLAAHDVSQVNATTVTRSYLDSWYLYTALCAVPGPLAVALFVEVRALGRKRTGAGTAVLTGLFIFLATVAQWRESALAFECVIRFLRLPTSSPLLIALRVRVEDLFGSAVPFGLSWPEHGWHCQLKQKPWRRHRR